MLDERGVHSIYQRFFLKQKGGSGGSLKKYLIFFVALFGVMFIVANMVYADTISSANITEDILVKFKGAAEHWAGVIQSAASRLFWSLVVISMVWTFGLMAIRKADLGEFFAEFTRFTIFTGFFWWLLTNAVTGMNIAGTIISSLMQLGAEAGGLPSAKMGPSAVMDLGFEILDITLSAAARLSWREFATSFTLNTVAFIVLIILALVAVNILLLLISSWFLLYGGIFLLGFGGARWTSDIAINYYKTVLGVAIQLMAMILITALGKQIMLDFRSQIMAGDIGVKELAVLLVASVILLFLVNKIPPLLAGIITGASIGGGGIGTTAGVGALAAAASMTAAAVATGGAALAAGGAAAAGGGQALMTAFKQASSNVASGTDILSKLGGSGGGGASSDNSSGGSSGSTPFASAAGFSGNSPDGGDSSGSFGTSSKGAGSGSSGMAKAGRIAADTTANLTKGAAGVAKNKIMSSISQTTGGKIASAIKNQGSGAQEQQTEATPTFSENSISAPDSKEVDAESEIAAFRDRDTI
jgi:type IV secretion system protein VirB6/type IV secretion system protein TrbL